jgi:signal transduction histidine kinase/ligand-binding sensor domain-containing protein
MSWFCFFKMDPRILLVILWMQWAQLAGQSPGRYGIAPNIALTNCSIDQWTGDNGLLSNNLTSVLQASSGFLWITTNNGLMRFDGDRLEVFDQSAIPFLATEAFYRVYEDKNKVLWFATRGNGIVRYVNNAFEQFLPENDVVPKSMRTLLIQDDGTIWAGSDYRGLIRIRDTVATRIDNPLLENVSILWLEQGRDGTIYIGTNSKGLLALQNGEIKPVPIDNDVNRSVNVVRALKDGRLLVGTTYGMYILDGDKTESVELLKNVQVNHIVVDHFGSVWVATERGLARINEKEGVREFLRSDRTFSGAHITSLCMDNEGSLWMSTGRSGLLRMKESPIRSYGEKHGLSIDRVNVIHEAFDGKFYICLDDGYVNVMEGDQIRPFPVHHPSWGESVRDLLVEEDGTVWIASYNGVLKKTSSGEKLFTTRDGLSSNSVRRIFRDSKRNLWFATRTGGVMQFRNNKVVKTYNRENALSSDYILAIEEDLDGRLLLGTHSGGMNVINPDGSVDVFNIQNDDDGVLIFNIGIDESRSIWLATSIGLYHFDFVSKKFTKIVLTNVVKGESYFDWVEDRKGNAWITTNIGILRIAKADVLEFLKGSVGGVKTRLFNEYDGMNNKECTGATRSMLASNGEIWVPTIEGIAVVNPLAQRYNAIPPPVYITDVSIDNNEFAHPSSPLVIGPGNMRITFRFTALSLLAPGKVKFKYQLSKVDDGWKDTQGSSRSVDYTNLTPGKYTFSVKAANNDGVWNEQGASLLIEVRPFFYQTAWFYILLIVLSVLLIFGIYKWRVTAIEQKNAELIKVNSELDRFVYSASHDLRAPLASILGLVKLTRLDPEQENRSQYLEMVEKSIHKLDGFIHDIINYSRNARTEVEASKVNFEALLNEIVDTLKYQEKSTAIRKEVKVEGSGDFYTDVKRLDIIMFNLVTNAIKYHDITQKDPFIRIHVKYSADEAVISVSDNGIGIEKHHVDNIFKMFYRADERSSGSGLGLFIAREAVEKLKGSLSVESDINRGSTFTITLPSLTGARSKK